MIVCLRESGELEDILMPEGEEELNFGEGILDADSQPCSCVGAVAEKIALCIEGHPKRAPLPEKEEEGWVTTYAIRPFTLEPVEGSSSNGRLCSVKRFELDIQGYPESFNRVKLERDYYRYVHCFHVKTFYGTQHIHHIVDMLVVAEGAQPEKSLVAMNSFNDRLC